MITSENPPVPDSENVSEPGSGTGAWSPEGWVDQHGDFLFNYAMIRLRDHAAAQDAVQETLLAGLRNQVAYTGTAGERGWLLGILKHKIHDHFRKMARQPSFTELNLQPDEATEDFAVNGLQQAVWAPELAPKEWTHPAERLDQEAFWQMFFQCAGKLPRATVRVFLLREMDGLGTAEICAMLQISDSHLWVLMHRARLALRRCLEINWFNDPKTKP